MWPTGLSSSTKMCLGVVSFVVILFGIQGSSWSYSLIFLVSFGKFSVIIFSNLMFVPLSPPALESQSQISLDHHVNISHVSHTNSFQYFLSLSFLCASVWISSSDSTFSSLILSSNVFNWMLNGIINVSDCILNSIMSIWFFCSFQISAEMIHFAV